jgi:thiol-disulfide isomerase/thioredoxin
MKKAVIALASAFMAAGLIGINVQAQSGDDKGNSADGGSTGQAAPASEPTPAAGGEQPMELASKHAKHSGSAVWNDVPTGFALAKKEHKPIITDFYTDWCGWCKVMEKKTFENPEVEKLMSDNFVLVRANAEDHGSGQRLSRDNRIEGYPTIIIFDESGTPKATMVGYQKVEPFMEKLKAFIAGKPIPSDE